MKHGWLLIAGIAGSWALPANAQMVTAQDPQSIARAFRAAGYEATVGVDKIGDPKVSSSIGRTKFELLFYNCMNHMGCATVQFHAGYDLKLPISLAKINEWNRTQRFGRAYLDGENDPILQMDLDLDDGGMSAPLFADNLEFWNAVLVNFEKHIGFE